MILYFNSHAHVERDPSITTIIMKAKISTHTLTWSVTQYPIRRTCCFQNFNSHAHVERDGRQCTAGFDYMISTHTLTWSVTSPLFYRFVDLNISTHTLTWSVTLDVVYIWCLLNVMRTYFFI